MTHAYDIDYLPYAKANLGEAFSYASIGCGIPMDQFLDRFLVSTLAAEFETGNPVYVAGMSGTELSMEVLRKTGYQKEFPMPLQLIHSLPEEYWCGWILAHYQWYSKRSFREIQTMLCMEDILQMYPALHQAPEEKFFEIADLRWKEIHEHTNLQKQRRLMAYSQRILAEKAGVNLRTLQQYESGAKDLHKASYDTVISLAKALECDAESILN